MASSTRLETYQYDELVQGADAQDSDSTGPYIRYLILHAGSGNDPLECTLHTAPMADTEFEAVSYVWGSDVRDQQIICDGRMLALTTNLFHVLQRIRLPDAPRSIWADLACINQENLEEKGHQVGIMGQIYRHASRVLIYMGGDHHGHGPAVCSLLEDICIIIDRILPLIPPGWNTFPYPRQDEILLNDPRWDSLLVLLGETWFTRGWVVREAGFAKDGHVHWGDSEFSWDSLMRTLHWLYKRGVKTLYAKGFDSCIPLAHLEVFEDRHEEYARLFTTEMTWVDQSLLGYLTLTRQLKLKDPRDRIYAFLELVMDEQRQVHLRPNYKDSFLLVYQQFAVEYIRSTKYIGLLSDVEHDDQSLNSGIPSWVPRWDLPLTRAGYAFAPADSGYLALTARDGAAAEPTVTDDNKLKTRGVIMDSVLYASEVLDFSTTTTDTVAGVWKAIENLAPESPYLQLSRLIVFVGVLTAGTREGDVWDWLRSDAAYYRTLFEKSGSPDDLVPPSWLAEGGQVELFHNTVKGYTHNRKVVLTQRGYFGLAPAVAQKGDSCGIIFGCTTPCILRPVGKADTFQYVGAVYMLGKDHWRLSDGRVVFNEILGAEKSKDWVEWDVEEQDIYLC
jgi:hypothetical protein